MASRCWRLPRKQNIAPLHGEMDLSFEWTEAFQIKSAAPVLFHVELRVFRSPGITLFPMYSLPFGSGEVPERSTLYTSWTTSNCTSVRIRLRAFSELNEVCAETWECLWRQCFESSRTWKAYTCAKAAFPPRYQCLRQNFPLEIALALQKFIPWLTPMKRVLWSPENVKSTTQAESPLIFDDDLVTNLKMPRLPVEAIDANVALRIPRYNTFRIWSDWVLLRPWQRRQDAVHFDPMI